MLPTFWVDAGSFFFFCKSVGTLLGQALRGDLSRYKLKEGDDVKVEENCCFCPFRRYHMLLPGTGCRIIDKGLLHVDYSEGFFPGSPRHSQYLSRLLPRPRPLPNSHSQKPSSDLFTGWTDDTIAFVHSGCRSRSAQSAWGRHHIH